VCDARRLGVRNVGTCFMVRDPSELARERRLELDMATILGIEPLKTRNGEVSEREVWSRPAQFFDLVPNV
jgi:hypothetical protein